MMTILITQYWFRWYLCSVGHIAIILTDCSLDPLCHMPSLYPNKPHVDLSALNTYSRRRLSNTWVDFNKLVYRYQFRYAFPCFGEGEYCTAVAIMFVITITPQFTSERLKSILSIPAIHQLKFGLLQGAFRFKLVIWVIRDSYYLSPVIVNKGYSLDYVNYTRTNRYPTILYE